MDKRSSQRLNSLRQDSFITPELNQGELLRFFAEVVWCLTSLLPIQGVIWEAIDQHSSRATLTDRKITASVMFQFDTEGVITSMRAEACCYRVVGDKSMFMTWVGNFREYAVRDGMQLPLEGEVGWEHPEGLRLYFKGKIININYKFALLGVAPMHMNKKGEA